MTAPTSLRTPVLAHGFDREGWRGVTAWTSRCTPALTHGLDRDGVRGIVAGIERETPAPAGKGRQGMTAEARS